MADLYNKAASNYCKDIEEYFEISIVIDRLMTLVKNLLPVRTLHWD
jgi:hypothetical protein